MTSEVVSYCVNRASFSDLVGHLRECDVDISPRLSSRVNIDDYAQKLISHAVRFEAWTDSRLVGVLAAYCNDPERKISYITNVSVLKGMRGNGIADRLMMECVQNAKKYDFKKISLEVSAENYPAIKLYEKHGFIVRELNEEFVILDLYLEGIEKHE